MIDASEIDQLCWYLASDSHQIIRVKTYLSRRRRRLSRRHRAAILNNQTTRTSMRMPFRILCYIWWERTIKPFTARRQTVSF